MSHEHRDAESYGPSSAEVGGASTVYDPLAILNSDERVFERLMEMSKMVQELHSVIFSRSMSPWIDRIHSYYLVAAYARDCWIHRNDL